MSRVELAHPRRLGESRPNKRIEGILCVIAGALIYTLQDVIIKLISGRYPLPQALTIRCIVAFVPLLFLIHLDGGLGQLRVRWSRALVLRGSLLLLSYTCYYLSIAALPLAAAVSLFYSSPLFLVALAGPMLGERVGLARWITILVGFAGVLIVARPDGAVIHPAALLSLAAAIFYALAQLMTRRLGATERASMMTLVQNVVYLTASLAMGVIAGGGGLAPSGNPSLEFLLRAWVWPAPVDLGLMALTGLIAASASWLQAHAYRIAPVNDVAPFEYSAIPWAVLAGLFIWAEIPSASTWPGILVIVCAGIYLLHRPRGRD